MNWQFPLYSIPILAGAIISSGLVFHSWQQKNTRSAKQLALLTLASAVWSFAYFLELVSKNIDLATTWLRFEYLGIVVVPVAWLILSLVYSGHQQFLTRRNLTLIFFIPMITIILVWTNGSHQFIWEEINQVVVSGFTLLEFEYGTWFWIHAFYSYALFLVGAFFLIRKVVNSPDLYQYQIVSLLAAAITPMIGNVLYILDWNPIKPLDLTAFAFLVSQIAFALGIFRYRLLDLIPIARDQVIESMVDGVIVLDPKERVVDINQAALKHIGFENTQIVGMPIRDVFAQWMKGYLRKFDFSKGQQDIQISSLDGPSKWFSITMMTIKSNLVGQKGQVIVIHDISERMQLATDLQDQQKFLLKLNEITRAAISFTEFTPMLQALADNMGGLFNSDGCYITSWNESEKRTTPLAASGELKDRYRSMEPLPHEKTVTESVVQEGRPLAVEDVFNTPYMSPEIAKRFPMKSLLAIPLITKIGTIGAVLIGFNNQHKFTDKEINRAEMVSKQIALAVSRMMSLELSEKRAKESESLRKATSVVASSLAQQVTIDQILEQLENLVDYEAAYVQLQNGIVLEVAGGRGKMVTNRSLNLRFPLSGTGLSNSVFRSRESMIIGNIKTASVEITQPFPEWVKSWMGVPLVLGKKVIGLLTLESTVENHFNEENLRVVETFANNVAIAVRNAQLMEEMQALAQIDDLTGLYNRRHLFKLGNLELQRARRYWHPLSVIMIDIDNFKKINDTFGHATGDEVLRSLAKNCLARIREVDIMGRYGGEEFVILLPETAVETAYQTAERLRTCIDDGPLRTKAGLVSLTISAGVAQLDLKMPDLSTLIDRADTALYHAKAGGRNRVVCYGNKTGIPGE